jgi:hypothetical protein
MQANGTTMATKKTQAEPKFDPKKIAPALVKTAHVKGMEAYKKLYNQSGEKSVGVLGQDR